MGKNLNKKVEGGPGRPSIYSEELAAKILARIATGESVRSVSRDNEMPAMSTIFDWAINNTTFSEHYARAKQIGAEIEAEEIEEIARDINTPVDRAKLIVDTKKWNLSKKLPKRFGDKNTLVTEDEGGKTMPILVRFLDGNTDTK